MVVMKFFDEQSAKQQRYSVAAETFAALGEMQRKLSAISIASKYSPPLSSSGEPASAPSALKA